MTDKLLKANSGNLQLGDVVTVDQTNSRLGVGTPSPNRPLEISGGDAQFRINNPDTGGGYWELAQTDNAFGAGGGKLVFLPDGATSANSVLTLVNSSGNVGIGTSSPVGNLHVKASSGTTTLWVQTAVSNGTGRIVFSENDTDAGFEIYHDGSGVSPNNKLQIRKNPVGTVVDINDNGAVTLGPSGGAAHTVNGSLNGIFSSTIANISAGRVFTVSGGANGSQTTIKFTASNHNGIAVYTYHLWNAGGNWTVGTPATNTTGTPPTVVVSGSGTPTATITVTGAGASPTFYGGGRLIYEHVGFITVA